MKSIKNKNEYAKDFFEEEINQSDRNILNIPEGCSACGGPYPSCMSSCPMYDD